MMENTETSKSVTDLRGIKNKKTRRSVESILDPDDLKKPAPDLTVRMLLIFAPDGAAEAENIVTGTLDFRVPELPHIRVDMMRLNEVRSIEAVNEMSTLPNNLIQLQVELWNTLLLNPEACLIKWLDEVGSWNHEHDIT